MSKHRPVSPPAATAADGADARGGRSWHRCQAAVGGIRSAEDAKAMIAAGVTRLGASAGIKIVRKPTGS